jgi:hypothetical protein
MQSHLSTLALISWVIVVPFRKSLTMLWSSSVCPSFSLVVSGSRSYIKSLIHFDLIFLYQVRDRGLVLVIYMWLSSFPNTIIFSLKFWWEWDGCSCIDLYLDPLCYSIGLWVYSELAPCYFFYYYDSVV